VEYHQVCAWLLQGDVQRAVQWANRMTQASGGGPDSPIHYSNEIIYRALVRVLLAQKAYEQALNALDRLEKRVLAHGLNGKAIEILTLRAITLQAQGKIETALQALGEALSLGEAEGYRRVFLDEGAPMKALLELASARRMAPQYSQQLLAAFPPLPAEASAVTSQADLIEALSEREIEVLGLIGEGLSNQEIATRLVISLGTVKAHTASIYRKLGVNSRTQALARAKELSIL